MSIPLLYAFVNSNEDADTDAYDIAQSSQFHLR